MSSETNKQIPIFGSHILNILFLIFLVLKLAEIGPVANWSWWWVTAPLWAPVAALIAILVIAAIILVLVNFINNNK